jgi:hypothetical protein
MSFGVRPLQPTSDHMLRVAFLIGLTLVFACRARPSDATDNRTAAVTAAQDTARRQWQHEVGVDSVQVRGDTTVVWVSPTNWMATDAPQAGVRVLPRGRIVSVQWIMGG